ncbi:MAG: winged helix-turn-helix transcriptional regulator [Solirubrobacterales bacterium]
MRAGAQALSLLSVPLNVHILAALAPGPMPLVDLRRAVGSPPQTTLRSRLRNLSDLGILERRRQASFPGTVDCELSEAGLDVGIVSAATLRWLRAAPAGPLEIDAVAAVSALKALAEGWSSTIVRALAARPLSLTELNRLISAHNYPSLERRLGAMRLAGQIEGCAGEGRGTPYAVTDWLRQAVAPLVAAARWERRHLRDRAAPVGRIDVEAYFLLALPLLRVSPDLSGTCRLAAELHSSNGEHHLAGAMVEVRRGQVVSCVSRLQGEAGAWASGSVSTWLRALLGEEASRLEVGGDGELVSSLLEGLRSGLFPVDSRS